MNHSNQKTVQLSHGGGGVEMNQLIQSVFVSQFNNDHLAQSEDASVLALQGNYAFTTDAFTVAPLFFAGGDIGKLAIAGTVNDLAMMAAQPQYLSASFIIEEGFAIENLKTIAQSMKEEAAKTGVKIVCGDTKIVPKGCADGVFITTTGIGQIQQQGISAHAIREGDAILISRDIGCHGAVILMQREALALDSDLHSDCESLWQSVKTLIDAKLDIHAMRDATRGGLAAVLNEWAQASQVQIEVDETAIPISNQVRGCCELFRLDPHHLANEGCFVLALPLEQAQNALTLLKAQHHNAAIIGKVNSENKDNLEHIGKVILTTAFGSRRYLDYPQGELLPRIC